MMKVTISLIVASSLVVCIYADCYRQNSCANQGKKYKDGETWTPQSESCYSCQCFTVRQYVRGCQEAVKEPVARTLKKSAIFETIYNTPDQSRDEEVEIAKDEADKVVCKPTPGPTFNWETWTFEYPILKNVYFYYNELQSQCCNRSFSVSTSDPSCKVVKVSKCMTKLVRKDDPTKPCDAPQFYRG